MAEPTRRVVRSPLRLGLPVIVALAMIVSVAVLLGRSHDDGSTPSADQYVEISSVPLASRESTTGPGASTGTFNVSCGRNERRHLNADNPVMSPGLPFGAHHTHEYVGNTSANSSSTDDSLAKAQSTCEGGDLSSYFWPVLRLTDGVGHDAHAQGGGTHGNSGQVLPPASVRVEFLGNEVSKVLPMPKGLRMITGDPMAMTNAYGEKVRARWSCSGREDRQTTKYPICEDGSAVVRTYEFASCWDGRNSDSSSHRMHVAFPQAGGACPGKTFPVPRLRLTVTYDVPRNRPFAIDSFPDERRDPATDHAMFINVMSDDLMSALVRCLNEGRSCSSSS